MSLTTPILHTTPAFDATEAHKFTFYVRGGDVVVANKLTIKNNVTLAEIYSQKQVTFSAEHILPANTLQNGTYYQAYLTTFNAKDEESTQSNIIQFHCYTTPSFNFSNIPADGVIQNSSFNFEVTYNQLEDVALSNYTFNLYSASGVLISTSGLQYFNSTEFPSTISYLFSGFDDGSVYEIECVGITAENTEITTNRVKFLVNYIAPKVYSNLFVDNNCDEGYVTIRSNILNIDGVSNPSPPIYLDNKEIDLRQKDSYVQWAEGYEITNNWTGTVWGKNFNPNSEIVKFSNTYGNKIIISYMKDTKVYAKLEVIPFGWNRGYEIFSNEIDMPDIDEQIFFWVRKVNGLFDLKIENRGIAV